MARLLLVEDNEHMRRIYGEKFRAEGFTVATAIDGEQGLAAVRAAPPPNAILLDLMLPKLSGFEFLKQLRADDALKQIPVFILSNKSWPDDVNYALALGARQFYAKGSTSLQEIVQQLRHECGLKKIMVFTRNAATAENLLAVIQHPALLGSVNTVFAEACAAVERGAPDAILLDARPPAHSAANVLQQLKTLLATRAIPVIAVTDQPLTLPRADERVAPNDLGSRLRPAVLNRLALTDAATIDQSTVRTQPAVPC